MKESRKMWPPVRGSSERTIVGPESEVWTPLRVMLWMIIVGDCMIVGAKLIKGLTWLHKHLVVGGRLWGRSGWLAQWWAEFSIHWPKHVIHVLIWTITVPPVLLLIKFTLEQWDKYYPPPDAKERAKYGPLGPFYAIRRWLVPLLRGGFRARYNQEFGAKNGNKSFGDRDRGTSVPGDMEGDLRHPPVPPSRKAR